MAKKKIFISYDYDNDKHYKDMLLVWDENSEFDFGFYDQSVAVDINSTDAAAIKREISRRINDSTYFLCLIGKSTYRSSWVSWEISKAIELDKKLVAVKIDSTYVSPTEIVGEDASWAMSFTFESIKNAIEKA